MPEVSPSATGQSVSAENNSNVSSSQNDEHALPPDQQPAPRRLFIWYVLQLILQVLCAVWFRYRVRGTENIPTVGAAMMVINHQSNLDPVLAGVALHRPVSFMARDNLFRVPILGWLMRNTHAISVSRTATSAASIRQSVNFLKEGRLLGIFPEGTRSKSDVIGPFRPGFVTIVRRAPCCVIPVGIAGGHLAMPRGALFIRPRRIRVVIGKPIPLDDVRELVKRGAQPTLVDLAREQVTKCQREAEQWRRGHAVPVDGAAGASSE